MSRTIFYGPKDVRATEVQLYYINGTFEGPDQTPLSVSSDLRLNTVYSSLSIPVADPGFFNRGLKFLRRDGGVDFIKLLPLVFGQTGLSSLVPDYAASDQGLQLPFIQQF